MTELSSDSNDDIGVWPAILLIALLIVLCLFFIWFLKDGINRMKEVMTGRFEGLFPDNVKENEENPFDYAPKMFAENSDEESGKPLLDVDPTLGHISIDIRSKQ